ncbi:MAG: hypothetical protein ACLUNQ_08915 [Oscillospiraceae bacterium]
MPFDEAEAAGRIELMGEETDNAFMENVMAMVNDRACVAKVADDFHVVYTPSTAAAGSWCPRLCGTWA